MQKRDEARELGLAVASVAMLAHFVDSGPAVAVAVLLALAAALGAGRIAGEWRPWRMPVIATALPAVTAFAIAGLARFVDPIPWLAVVFGAGWVVMIWVIGLETSPEALKLPPVPVAEPTASPGTTVTVATSESAPAVRIRPRRRAEFDLAQIVAEPVIVKTIEIPPHPRPLAVRVAALGLAFAAFTAIGGLVPGGLVVSVGEGQELSTRALLAFAALNGAVAGVVGYRLAGLLSPHWFDQIVRRVAVIQYAVVIGLAAAALRSLTLPRLYIPALLTLLVYVLTQVRESTEPVTLNRRLLQELAILAVAALATVGWALLSR
jgi:hypothetical protein